MIKTLASPWAAIAAMCALSAVAETPVPPAKELTARDKVAMEAAFTAADANGDGKLSKDEAAKLPAIAARFVELDRNKDGFLSMAEFAAGYTVG